MIPAEAIRAFYRSTEAWYGPSPWIDNDIYFGLYSPEGGTYGEMSIEWIELEGRQVPKLQVYDDAWYLLEEFYDVLKWLADHSNHDVTPEEVMAGLLSHGFKDQTEREAPGQVPSLTNEQVITSILRAAKSVEQSGNLKRNLATEPLYAALDAAKALAGKENRT